MELTEEITLADRLEFDACIAESCGFSGAENDIYNALERVYRIRKSARE
jgi:hypothetical protein